PCHRRLLPWYRHPAGGRRHRGRGAARVAARRGRPLRSGLPPGAPGTPTSDRRLAASGPEAQLDAVGRRVDGSSPGPPDELTSLDEGPDEGLPWALPRALGTRRGDARRRFSSLRSPGFMKASSAPGTTEVKDATFEGRRALGSRPPRRDRSVGGAS